MLAGKLGESNTILGLGGDDTLTGGNLSDSIEGGDGDDLILGGGGTGNVLVGGAGADRLIAQPDYSGVNTYNRLDGGDGADSLVGGISDILIGGDGNDTIEGDYRLDVRAGTGDDLIDIGLFDSTVDGGAGVDTLIASESLRAASITNVEILAVDGYLSATVEELDKFSSIRSADPDSIFSLGVSGSIDLSAKLGNSSVSISTGASSAKIVTGGGNDNLRGDYGAYWLDGGGGNDTIETREGASTLVGGAGDDEIISTSATFLIDGGTGDDVIRLSSIVESGTVDGGAGYDLLVASGDLSEAEISGVEALASAGPVTATAAQFEAFQKISGANLAGYADLWLAGAGVLDIAQELGQVDASITGSAGSDAITSGAGDDTITGGEGADTIHGGAGSDLLFVDSASDQIFGDAGDDTIEIARYDASVIDGGTGRDTLAVNYSSFDQFADLSKSSINAIETLVINVNSVSATADQFETFETISNYSSRWVELRVVGGGAVDLSDELAAKAAKMFGSTANDVIRTGAGEDTISGGKGDDSLDGSSGDDTLLGGAGDDTLYGGDGRDRLDGGQGSDLYIIDDAREHIADTGHKGVDTVSSSVSLKLFDSVENLQLIGSADLDGTGNRAANFLVGNSGDNRLDGGGRADILQGRGGDDVFVFSTRPKDSNIDQILDFGKGNDLIELDHAVFDGLSAGGLKPSAFKEISGDKDVIDKNDRILYDSKTGQLFFDEDGSGKSKAILFAELKGAPDLSADDFLIV